MKWAGGGFLSTVGDLLQFGNAMLYSYQKAEAAEEEIKTKQVVYRASPFSAINNNPESAVALPPVLKPGTMKMLWTPMIKTSKDGDGFYGLGWAVTEEKTDYAYAKKHRFYAAHSGGAVGASSILLVYPRKKEADLGSSNEHLPQGVVVAIICNMQNTSVSKVALNVAKIFENLPVNSDGYKVRRIVQCSSEV